MVHVALYKAEFECENGHRFTSFCDPDAVDGSPQQVRCPVCLEEWIAANVPNGVQSSPARQAPIGSLTMSTNGE